MIGFAAPGFVGPCFLPTAFLAPQFGQQLRIATAAWHSDLSDVPPSTTWHPRILSGVEVAQSIVSALGIGGAVALTASDIVVHDQDGWAEDMARYNAADGRAAEIRVAEVIMPRQSEYGTPLRATGLTWTGTVRRVTRMAGRRARISFTDATARMEAALQPLKFAGTGGLDGPESLADLPRPVCIGRVFNIPPVALGNIDLGDGALPTYQSHWRAITGHTAVRIRGVEQAEVLGAPGLAQWRDWPALGMFQLGSTPDGTVSCDVSGEAEGAPSDMVGVLWALLSTLGPQYTDPDRDPTSWAIAAGDLPGIIGVYQGASETRALDVVQRLLTGTGACIAGDRDGRLRLFDPFTASTAIQFDIGAGDIVTDPVPIDIPDALAPAPYRVEVEWGAAGVAVTDLAASVDDDMRARLSSGEAPIAAWASTTILQRVAQQRTLRLRGPYAELAGAQARAERIGQWLEGGARAIRVTTDRYLGALNLGDVGRVAYPGYGLDGGMVGVIVGLREMADARRVTVDLVGAEG